MIARQARIHVQKRSDKRSAQVDAEASKRARVRLGEARSAVAAAKRFLERSATVA